MKKLELVLFTFCLTGITQLAAICATEDDLFEQAPIESVLSHGTMHEAGFFRAVISLIIVIGMIYLTAWLYKKLNVFNVSKLAKSSPLLAANKFKLISSQTLGTNKNLHVVEINDKYLVIGTTQNSINLIKEFDKSAIDTGSVEEVASPEVVEKNVRQESVPSVNDIIQPSDSWVNDLIDKYNEEE